jgi:hypothetical protein
MPGNLDVFDAEPLFLTEKVSLCPLVFAILPGAVLLFGVVFTA